MVEHDKLISFLICSIDVEKSIGTTNRIFEWARIPERIEVFVKFDIEDYNQEQVEKEFKKRVSYNDNVKLVLVPVISINGIVIVFVLKSKSFNKSLQFQDKNPLKCANPDPEVNGM